MTAVQPPGFMQALNNHSALTMRRNTMLLMDGAPWGDAVPRGGIHPAYGGTLTVTGSASQMQVTVASGMAAIPHSQAFGGLYSIYNDGNVVLDVDPADSSQYRRDLVIAEILDTTDGDGSDLWQLRVVKGTNSSSPPAPLPTIPDKSEILGTVNVDPGITNLTGKIDGNQRYIPTAGGTLLSAGDSDRVVSPRVGMLNTQADQNKRVTYWDGTAWRFIADNGWISYTPAVSGFGSGTFSVRSGRYKWIAEKTIMVSIFIRMANAGTGSANLMVGLPATPSRSIVEQVIPGRWGDGGTLWYAGCGSILNGGSGAWIDRIRFPTQGLSDADLDSLIGTNMGAGSEFALTGPFELA